MFVCFARYLLMVFLVLAWTLPYALTRHTYPIPTFYSELATLILYLLMACVCACLGLAERCKTALGIPRIAWVPAAFCALLLGQVMLLPLSQPSMNVLAIGFLSAAFITVHLGFWAAQLGLTEKIMRYVAFALLAGGLFAVFCQLMQLARLDTQFAPWVVPYYAAIERRPFGNMAQANHLSTYLSFAITAALFLVQTRRLPLFIWMILSAVFITGQALTVSRMAWLQLLVILIGGVAMGWLEKQRTQTQRQATALPKLGEAALSEKSFPQQTNQSLAKALRTLPDWLAPALLLVIFIGVNWAVRAANEALQWQLADAATKRFQEVGQLSPRLALWHYGWSMFKTHPWLGVGWGEFPRYEYALLDKLGTVEIANNTHNILLDLLAKTGVIGAGLVLISLACWLWRTTLARHAPKNATRVFCLMLLAVLAVHALFEYPQQYLFFLLPAAFLLGMLETRATWPDASTTLKVSYLLLTVASLLALYPVWRDYQRTETLYYGKHPQQQYRANPARLFSAWGQYGLASLLPLNEKMLASKLTMHTQALSLLPGQIMLQRYAVLLVLAGREEEALGVVKRLQLFSMSLRNWPAELASLYKLCDEQGTALTHFKKRLVFEYGTVEQASNKDN